MEFLKKIFGKGAKNKDSQDEMSSEEKQEEEPMEIDDDNFNQDLEAVDSPEVQFDAAGNASTEEEEDADEENRDPRHFLSTELTSRQTGNADNENSEEEADLDISRDSPAIGAENTREEGDYDPLSDDEKFESPTGSPKDSPTLEDQLLNGESKGGEEEQEAHIDLIEGENSEKEDDDEEPEKQKDPFEDEESNDSEVREIEKEGQPCTANSEDNSNSNEKGEIDKDRLEDQAENSRSSREDEGEIDKDRLEDQAEISRSSREDEGEIDKDRLEDQAENSRSSREDEGEIDKDRLEDQAENSQSSREDEGENETDPFVVEADEEASSSRDENESHKKTDLFVTEGEDAGNSRDDDDGPKESNIFVAEAEDSDDDDNKKDKKVKEDTEDEEDVVDVDPQEFLDDEDKSEKNCNEENGKDSTNEIDEINLEADEDIKTSSEPSPEPRTSSKQKDVDRKSMKAEGGDDKSDEDDDVPRLRINSLIFDQPAEEDDDDNVDIQSMMQVEMMEEEDNEMIDDDYQISGDKESRENNQSRSNNDDEESEGESRRARPRRAAAQVAANTIKKISSELYDDDVGGRTVIGRRPSEDKDYEGENENAESPNSSSNISDKHKCHICKKMAGCPIVVRQFGSDIHMCSNSCFNTFRNPDPSKRPLPCSQCNKLSRDTDEASVYYWETMNFCSDVCVGNYQMQVGGNCATCLKKVLWNCLGKYCVRFGSDIRQFCTASCLESYKKNARVCFHCQLDIKKLGNVVLANIPAKATPKEFCGQDCVEMYIDQNLKSTVRPNKQVQYSTCVICGYRKVIVFHMCTPNANFKVCSEVCWKKLLMTQNIEKPVKCESCTKFINMDIGVIMPSNYISTAAKVHGFCSPTCKNVFVLKNRQILACSTCKVKKYNYDLIEFISNKVGASGFAVCSLNCIPKGTLYAAKLRDTLVHGAAQISRHSTTCTNTGTVSVITTTASLPHHDLTKSTDAPMQIQSIVALADGDFNHLEVTEAEEREVEQAIHNIELLDAMEAMKKLYDEVLETLEEVTADEETETRTVSCWVRPKYRSKQTQTDVAELDKMEKIEVVAQEKIIYVPVPIPYPVLLPFPFYALETPVPFPFPVPLPIPIPIPVLFPDQKESETSVLTDPDTVSSEVLENPKLDSNAPIQLPSSRKLLETDSTCSSSSMEITNSPSSAIHHPSLHGSGKSKSQILSDSGLRAWRSHYGQDCDPVQFKSSELGQKLSEFVNKVKTNKGEKYPADTLLYLCLGIQQYLRDNGRTADYIFYDSDYNCFVQSFTTYAEDGISRGINLKRIDDNFFWETTELGAPSPGVLLFTLIYFNYKYFSLKTWEAHADLQFKQVVIKQKEDVESGNIVKYLTITNLEGESEDVPEHCDLKERCPVKLFEFYNLKCPNQDGSFFKTMKKSYTPHSEWFTEEPLDKIIIYQMFVRAMMIRADGDT